MSDKHSSEVTVHTCFIMKAFSANKKAEGHRRGRIDPLHDSVFSISHMKFWIDVLVITAFQIYLLCLEIPPFPTPLENSFITCPNKMPHGVVLD